MDNKSKKAVVWGDSVAKGVIYDESRGRYSLSKITAISSVADQLGIEIINHSKMGNTIENGLLTMQKDLETEPDFDYGIIEFGGNDCDFDWAAVSENPNGEFQPKTPINEFKLKLMYMVDLLKEKGIRPVLVTLPPISAERYFDFVSRNLNPENILRWLGEKNYIYRFQEQYSLAVTRIAQECGCTLLDLRSSFLAIRNSLDYICMDGIHPNSEGQKFMGKTILDAVSVL